jgi:hypothetical protein
MKGCNIRERNQIMETYRLDSRGSLVSRSSTGAAASTTLGNVGVVGLISHFIIVGVVVVVVKKGLLLLLLCTLKRSVGKEVEGWEREDRVSRQQVSEKVDGTCM